MIDNIRFIDPKSTRFYNLLTHRPRYYKMMRKESFYRKHELAIWIIIVVISIRGLYIIINNNEFLWNISTPIINLLP